MISSSNEKWFSSKLNSYSTAEQASAVTCSSLLTMPPFYRHVAPKIASMLSSSHKSPGGGGGSDDSKKVQPPIVPGARHLKMSSHWYDLYNTTTSGSRLDTYLELHDSPDWQSPMTTIHGGSPHLSSAEQGSRGEADVTSEEVIIEAGIVKTVRMEQYPEAGA